MNYCEERSRGTNLEPSHIYFLKGIIDKFCLGMMHRVDQACRPLYDSLVVGGTKVLRGKHGVKMNRLNRENLVGTPDAIYAV